MKCYLVISALEVIFAIYRLTHEATEVIKHSSSCMYGSDHDSVPTHLPADRQSRTTKFCACMFALTFIRPRQVLEEVTRPINTSVPACYRSSITFTEDGGDVDDDDDYDDGVENRSSLEIDLFTTS